MVRNVKEIQRSSKKTDMQAYDVQREEGEGGTTVQEIQTQSEFSYCPFRRNKLRDICR
jgi:hypothetical protein